MIDEIIKNLSDGNIYTIEEIAELTDCSIEYVSGVLNNATITQTKGDGSGVIYYMDIKYDTIVDGEGFRNTIYCAKCNLHCEKCHNPSSWDIKNGKPITINELFDILANSRNDITFSGGETTLQAKSFIILAKKLKKIGKNIWLYTGYSFDIISKKYPELLDNIDVVVDGKYINSLKDTSLLFRGSSNQHIWKKINKEWVIFE